MNEPKSWLDQAVEILVYAPVGALLAAAEDLPALVDKGRAKVTGELTLARMVGNFAVNQGQTQASKLAQEWMGRLGDLAHRSDGTPKDGTPKDGTPKDEDDAWLMVDEEFDRAGGSSDVAPDGDGPDLAAPVVPPVGANSTVAPSYPTSNPKARSPRPARTRSGGESKAKRLVSSGLAIPGYDSLSASQVVQRLAGLTQSELEAVRAYETQTRDRKTIVHRAAQLLAASVP
ncbi:MAG: hypothetical protein ACYCS7_12520 [Acidimicrobiales bacterium]